MLFLPEETLYHICILTISVLCPAAEHITGRHGQVERTTAVPREVSPDLSLLVGKRTQAQLALRVGDQSLDHGGVVVCEEGEVVEQCGAVGTLLSWLQLKILMQEGK